MCPRVRQLSRQCKLADYLSLPQLETIIPASVIQEVLTDCQAWEQREKKLNMQAMIYLIIALALYPHCGTREVWRRLLEGVDVDWEHPRDIPTAGALCQRRQQLAVTPVRRLFDRLARPLALPHTRSAFRFGLRLVAVDGTLENLPDTDANRTVFPYHCEQEHSRSPFPQARCVLLMECGTHAIFDVEITPVQDAEQGSVLTLIERSVRAGMFLLCDAGITSSHVLALARRQGAHVLGRLASQTWKHPWVRLQDGSYLASIDREGKQRGELAQTVRILEYRLPLPDGGYSEPIRLVTTCLDPKQYPLEALIRVYHERWEIEMGIDEVKTHLSLSRRTVRSQTPQGVEQELYGLLLAYFAVRTLMYAAAVQVDWDPDEVSFVHTLHVIGRSQWRLMQVHSLHRGALRQALLQELREERVPARRLRFHGRVVKRTRSRYPRKSYAHLRVPCFQEDFFDQILLI